MIMRSEKSLGNFLGIVKNECASRFLWRLSSFDFMTNFYVYCLRGANICSVKNRHDKNKENILIVLIYLHLPLTFPPSENLIRQLGSHEQIFNINLPESRLTVLMYPCSGNRAQVPAAPHSKCRSFASPNSRINPALYGRTLINIWHIRPLRLKPQQGNFKLISQLFHSM